jgi:hypothetical protein
LLTRFGEKILPRCELPADPHATRLREMLEYRRVLSEQIVAAENRLELSSGYLRKRLQVQIATFKSSMIQVETDIATSVPPIRIWTAKPNARASFAAWDQSSPQPLSPIFRSSAGSTARSSPRS